MDGEDDGGVFTNVSTGCRGMEAFMADAPELLGEGEDLLVLNLPTKLFQGEA